MFFSDIFDPAERGNEPVSRYNAVNMLLRSDDQEPVAEVSKGYSMTVVELYNISDLPIRRFYPAAITGIHEEDQLLGQEDRAVGQAVVAGIPAENDDHPWGIALESIVPGSSGEVAVAGCVPAIFYGSSGFVFPDRLGMDAGKTGSARVLIPTRTGQNGVIVPGLLLLGAANPFHSSEYYGIFKLSALSPFSVAILSSFAPDSDFCGITDVPGCDFIPRTVLNFEDTLLKNIYLVFFYDQSSRIYRAEFMTYLPENAVFYKLIGTFQNGRVNQIYRENGWRMSFGEEWYLR